MKNKLLAFHWGDMKKSIFVGIVCFLATLSACSSRQIMKDCRSLSQGYWDCDKP